MLTVFEDGVKATEPVKVPPEVSDTSYPVGAVTVRSETRFAPETEKLCSAETKPLHEVKALSVPVLFTPNFFVKKFILSPPFIK